MERRSGCISGDRYGLDRFVLCPFSADHGVSRCDQNIHAPAGRNGEAGRASVCFSVYAVMDQLLVRLIHLIGAVKPVRIYGVKKSACD